MDSRMVERLVGVGEKAAPRAEQRVELLEHRFDSTWVGRELRGVESYIERLKPGKGFELTPEGERDMAKAKEARRGLLEQWQEMTGPANKRAKEIRAQARRLEQALKKAPHLNGESEQLRRLLGALDPLEFVLTPAEVRTLNSARTHLKSLEQQAATAAAAPVEEAAEPEAAQLEAYLPPAEEPEFDPGDQQIVERLAAGQFEPAEDYALNLAAQHLSLAGGFDVLLCLQLLRGVEHYPFQINTARQVMRTMRGRALLCDEVGLGKTIEAGLILKEYLVRGLARRILVLTPPALVSQWRSEMQDKFGVAFATHEDPEFRALGEAAWERTDRVIASLHTAKNPTNSVAIQRLAYDLIIVDEAHHVKNRTTVNWKFINGLKSKYLLLLTATPVQNNLDELFNLITLLSPGQLKTPAAFRREFVARGDARQPRNRTKLRELLMDVMVRNTRSQVSVVLPPRRASTLRVRLTPVERDLYDATTRYVRQAYQGRGTERFMAQTLQMEAGSSPAALRSTLESMMERAKSPNPALAELRDLAVSATSSAKASSLLDLLHQRPDKLLIFTRFRATQQFLLGILDQAGIAAATFSGQMSATEKDAQVSAFAGDRRVMVSTDVGSEGRNLQFCHTLVNYDLPWNPMQIEQRVGRVHRIGQTEPVHIFNLAAHDTVEDYVLEVLDSKINMFELVVGEVGEILGNLEEEREFEDVVMDLWLGADSQDSAREAFIRFGNRLVEARCKYDETRAYDENLFGEDFVAEG